ncbi:hypothetical protein B0H14DRAFT_3891012 [Mycena olivaceomarginata]|nr:hypothetical protein B0H14DRAFT_3891012 [Mycena olivaceomarginata]
MTTQALNIASELKALDLHVPTLGDYSSESMSDLSELDDSDGDEEGELSEEGELPETKKRNTMHNQKRHERRADRRRHKWNVEAQELESAQQEQKKVLALLYNCDVSQIHIHNVQRNMAALKLQACEEEKSHPLSRADIDELIPNTIWISEPGIHLGFLSETGKETLTIVFAVKIKSDKRERHGTKDFTPVTRFVKPELVEAIRAVEEEEMQEGQVVRSKQQ